MIVARARDALMAMKATSAQRAFHSLALAVLVWDFW